MQRIHVTYLKDYTTLKFKNGSQLDVVLASDAARGGRRHGGLIDEVRKDYGIANYKDFELLETLD